MASACKSFERAREKEQSDKCLAAPAFMAEELNVRCEQLRHRGNRVQETGAQNKSPEERHLEHFFGCKTRLLDGLLVFFCCKLCLHGGCIEGHAVGKRSAFLGSALNEDGDEGNGADRDSHAEHHVQGPPALQVGTKYELTNDVPYNATDASHCENDACYRAVVGVEPAAKNTSGHSELDANKAKANDEARNPIAPNCRVYAEAHVGNNNHKRCYYAYCFCVELVKEFCHGGSADALAQINKGNVE